MSPTEFIVPASFSSQKALGNAGVQSTIYTPYLAHGKCVVLL